MKQLSLIFATLILSGSLLWAQQTTTTETTVDPNAADIEFEFETYDFGVLQEGDPATIDFYFTNTGKSDLKLTNVKASCGCTTPFWSKEEVKPGETGKLSAKYNTKGRIGKFTKPITITSNASSGVKRIFIKGEVKKAEPEQGVPERKPSMLMQPSGF